MKNVNKISTYVVEFQAFRHFLGQGYTTVSENSVQPVILWLHNVRVISWLLCDVLVV